MAKYYSCCGGKGNHVPGCESAGPAPAPREPLSKGHRERVVGDLSKETADAWIKRMGNKAEGGGPRHYEREPDPDNPGKFILYVVKD